MTVRRRMTCQISITREWKTKLNLNGNHIAKVRTKRRKSDGDSLSPLLFVISIIPLSLVLRKSKAGMNQQNKYQPPYRLLLYAKEIKQLDALVHTVRIFSKPWDEIWDREMCSSKKGSDNKSSNIAPG